MNLLLDTQILLWSLNEPARLPASARATIEEPGNEIWVSSISLWEVAIKTQLGKLKVSGNLIVGIQDQRMQLFSFSAEHAMAVSRLPLHHSDPFDRALLAQARSEGFRLITADRELGRYSGVVNIEICA